MAPKSTAKYFRFFDLPQELRDAVYDYLSTGARRIPSTNHRTQRRPSDSELATQDSLCTSFQLVNKQFRAEYEHRQAGRGVLIINAISMYYSRELHHVPKMIGDCVAMHLTIRSRAICLEPQYRASTEHDFVVDHREFEDVLRQLPSVRTVALTVLFTDCHGPVPALKQKFQAGAETILSAFLVDEKIVAVDVFLTDERSSIVERVEAQSKWSLGEWKRGDGWSYAG